jgi:hypothetical protein
MILNNTYGGHIQGSPLFDLWRDPDGFLVEHFAGGDMFDSTLESGGHRSPFRGWPRGDLRLRHEAISMIGALCDDKEFDINRLIGLLKEANSLLSQSFEPTAPGGSKLPPGQPKSRLSPLPPVTC